MKTRHLDAATKIVMAVCMLGAVNCMVADDKSNPDVAKSTKDALSAAKTVKKGVDVEKKAREGLGGLIYHVSPTGVVADVMNTPEGQKRTQDAYNNILGNHGDQGTLVQNMNNADNLDGAPKPSGKYYDDPRIDPADQQKLRDLNARRNDPDTGSNVQKQINNILGGYPGVVSDYTAARDNAKDASREAAEAASDNARNGVGHPDPVHPCIPHHCH